MKKIFNRRSLLVIVACVVLTISVLASNIWARVKIAQKQKELDAINEQIATVEMDNKSIDYLLNEADERELFERLARGKGYAYPDEKIYYDVTPGN